jgi:murein DD-endopeptidase MepM/ murein hydrolase activator NlpD
MARLLRATLLLTALGVAAPALPTSAAAANAGGAAPGTLSVSVSASASSVSNGGAGPDAVPQQTATSSDTGGAVVGRKPARRVARKPVKRAKPRRRAPRRAAPPTPVAPPAPTVPPVAGVFPLAGGIYSFGGDDARFGATRPGHIHQGQDLTADSGTPIVAPVAGTVTWKGNQEGGAGVHLVVRGVNDARDYVFMHIKWGTVAVAVGDQVTAGQQLAQVGSTGSSSGPHLHFEIWVGGWWERGGAPIDPLPQLQLWAGLSPSL